MMPSSTLDTCIFALTFLVLLDQYVPIVQAGNCFNHRMNDMCYDLSTPDASEEQCTSPYYSDDSLQALDGYAYAEHCRNVHVLPKPCDVDCGLGQECQWINGEEMCVCSEESCSLTDALSTRKQAVCASNNMTFASECAMAAWKCFNHQSALYKKYDGECQKECQNVHCPHDAVCLLVKNTGEPFCYPKKHCHRASNSEPVCGTDGVTYSNTCTMRLNPDAQGRTAEVAHKGPCESSCRANLCQKYQRCVHYQSRPVCIRCDFPPRFYAHSGECSMNIAACGDDGVLYRNYCAVLRSQCEKNRYIQIVDYETCPEKTNTMQ